MRRMLAVLLVVLGSAAMAQGQIIIPGPAIQIVTRSTEPDSITASALCFTPSPILISCQLHDVCVTKTPDPMGSICEGVTEYRWAIQTCTKNGCVGRPLRVPPEARSVRIRKISGKLYHLRVATDTGLLSQDVLFR